MLYGDATNDGDSGCVLESLGDNQEDHEHAAGSTSLAQLSQGQLCIDDLSVVLPSHKRTASA